MSIFKNVMDKIEKLKLRIANTGCSLMRVSVSVPNQ